MKKVLFIFFISLFFNFTPLWAKDNIIRLDKIKPGMKGYGKTVFTGTKIEKFNIEVIGVLKGIRPRTGLILIKVKDKRIEKTGIIAGMSGSPIYIKNKLAGALAFSWAFAKEPIAVITPIQDMLNILSLNYTNFHGSINYYKKFYAIDNKNASSIVPVKTPLVFDYLSDNIINIFTEDFKKFNFMPISGVSSGTNIEIPKKFEPGSAVGVNLITGDMNLSGIGTVTYVNKNKILIFGHPMFFAGNVDMPLSYAYIYTVMPSIFVSFKLGQATKIVGRIYQDQLAGLAGKIGEMANMIPLSVNVNFFGELKKFHFNIIRNYNIFPLFLSLAIYRSIELTGGWKEKNTLQFTYKVFFDDGNFITLQDTITALTTIDSIKNSIMYLFTPMSAMLFNKFKKINIKKVSLDLKINNKLKIVEIKKVSSLKKEYQPGEEVVLNVQLKPYQEKPFYKKLKIKLPMNLKNNSYTIIVSSAREQQIIDYMLSPAKYVPQNYEQLLDLINSFAKSTEISVWGFLKNKGIVINGDKINSIPSSYLSIIKNSLETSAIPVYIQISDKISLDYIVVGRAILNLKIKKKNF